MTSASKTPEVVLAPARESDKPAVRDIWEQCFPDEPAAYTDWYFSRIYDPANTYCAYLDGKPVAHLQANPYPLLLRDRVLQVSSLAGVSTLPEYRGRGIASRLIRYSLSCLRARGDVLSFLYPDPAPYSFYEHFGYAVGWQRQIVETALNELPDAASLRQAGYTLKTATESFAAAFAFLYRTIIQDRQDACVSRDETYMVRKLEEASAGGTKATLLHYKQQPVGYSFWDVSGDRLQLEEFVCMPEHRSAFLALLASASPGTTTVQYSMPAGAPVSGPSIVDPGDMVRLLNFPACFSGIAVRADFTPVTVKVTDELLPENNGLWKMYAEHGKLVVSPATDGPASREADISDWSRIATGIAKLSELQGTTVTINREDASISLDEILSAGKVPFLYEMF